MSEKRVRTYYVVRSANNEFADITCNQLEVAKREIELLKEPEHSEYYQYWKNALEQTRVFKVTCTEEEIKL